MWTWWWVSKWTTEKCISLGEYSLLSLKEKKRRGQLYRTISKSKIREKAAGLLQIQDRCQQGAVVNKLCHPLPSALSDFFSLIASISCSRCEDSFMSSFSGLGMAQEEDKHSLESKFAAAVKVIRSLPEEGDDLLKSVIEPMWENK